MRNRTELVVNKLPSDNEEEPSDLDDSEEDWKPSEKKGAAGKVTKPSPKSAGKRKSGGKAPAKKTPAKRSKKDDSEEEDEDEEEEEESEEDIDEDEEEESGDGKTPKKSAPPKKTKSSLNAKGFPDKEGKFDLYIFKNDLSKDFKNDPKLCMWRRDGSSLLQKYLKAQDEENDKDILFKASSVYSCWEEKRKHDFFEVKVQCVGDKKDGVVKVLDVDELEKFASEDRPLIDTGINEDDGGEGEENEEDDDEQEEPEDEE